MLKGTHACNWMGVQDPVFEGRHEGTNCYNVSAAWRCHCCSGVTASDEADLSRAC